LGSASGRIGFEPQAVGGGKGNGEQWDPTGTQKAAWWAPNSVQLLQQADRLGLAEACNAGCPPPPRRQHAPQAGDPANPDFPLHVMGYVFGGTLAHLQSCISTGRVAAARELATQTAAAVPVVDGATVAAEAAGAVPAAKRSEVGGAGKGGPMQEPAQHEQEQLSPTMPPQLALVSHALALAATPAPQPVGSGSTGVMDAEARQHLQAALARLAAESAEGGCEWLQAYCDFLQRRHRLG
jgi:hypothetical protein